MDNPQAASTGTTEAARFVELWQAHSARVLAYAMRHVSADSAQEVLSETFLVAWRRLQDVPGEPLPWLLVVARNTIANQRRTGYRQALLQAELQRLEYLAEPACSAEVTVTERATVLAGLAALTHLEREALLLTAWDGLLPAQAAAVADCSIATFHVRLFRARRRLRAVASSASQPTPARTPSTVTRSTS